jgi:hypothetical protein
MDVRPGLPETDNFQHWPPWRPLVVETAWRVHDYVGGTVIMPMTVVVQAYWREIADGLAAHGVPVRHLDTTGLEPHAVARPVADVVASAC